MKIVSLSVIAVVIVSAIGLGTAYADTSCSPQGCAVRQTCPTSAYDRTPICVEAAQPEGRCGAGPQCVAVDPWDRCGALCTGGQLPTGSWPYGWRSEYWLRPDSNF